MVGKIRRQTLKETLEYIEKEAIPKTKKLLEKYENLAKKIRELLNKEEITDVEALEVANMLLEIAIEKDPDIVRIFDKEKLEKVIEYVKSL